MYNGWIKKNEKVKEVHSQRDTEADYANILK